MRKFIQALGLLFLLVAGAEAGPKVVVIGIDEATQSELGPFGGAYRKHHARLIEQLNAAGARGIAFDMDFAENPKEVAATQALADAAGKSKAPVVVGVYMADRPDGSRAVDANAAAIEAQKAMGQGHFLSQPELIVEGGLARAQKEFDQAAQAGRDPELAIRTGERLILAEAGGRRGLIEELLIKTGDARGGDLARLGVIEQVPVGLRADAQGRLVEVRVPAIRPRVGRASEMTTVSYADVLAGRVDASVLRDAVVLVGMNDGVRDMQQEPNPARPEVATISGVYLHAYAAQRALERIEAEAAKGAATKIDPVRQQARGIIKTLGGAVGALGK